MLVPRPIVHVADGSKCVTTDRFSHVSCGEFHSAAVAHCPEPRLLVWGDCDHLLSHDEMGHRAGVSESSSKALKCDVTRLLFSPGGGGGGGGVRIRQVIGQ